MQTVFFLLMTRNLALVIPKVFIAMDLSEIGKAAGLKEAKAIATDNLGSKIVSAGECMLQGMFSYTVKITMQGGARYYVVQLRAEIVYEENSQQVTTYLVISSLFPFVSFGRIFNSPVPFAYIMPRIPGLTYYTSSRRTTWPTENHIK